MPSLNCFWDDTTQIHKYISYREEERERKKRERKTERKTEKPKRFFLYSFLRPNTHKNDQYVIKLLLYLTPMMALSSVMVTCFALSTAVATCCWCCNNINEYIIRCACTCVYVTFPKYVTRINIYIHVLHTKERHTRKKKFNGFRNHSPLAKEKALSAR